MVVSADVRPVEQLGATPAPRRDLLTPIVDFLGLGGLSLALWPAFALLPSDRYQETVSAYALLFANLINHPHFANSYQIFYSRFSEKAFGEQYSRMLRARYVFAGLVVPVLLAFPLIFAMVDNNTDLAGAMVNAMGFFVGWHYVKQGYGMLMVDAALKRRFFTDIEKRLFRINGYAVWAVSWLAPNTAGGARDYWGLSYAPLDLPSWLLTIAYAVAIVAGLATLVTLARRRRLNGGMLPYIGVTAYAVTLYLWILPAARTPLWLLVVPALHSLQYLVVVWRYRINVDGTRDDAFAPPHAALLRRFVSKRATMYTLSFLGLGLVLGFTGFWLAPFLLHLSMPGTAGNLSLITVWVFINIHHYFLDNVMWRSENPDVRRYLFGR